EPDHLIHIFLALASSTEIDLGFDPTIKYICNHITLSEGPSVPNSRSIETGPAESSRKETQSSGYVLPAKQRVYHILVKAEEGVEHTFETVRLLSSYSAKVTRSHGTRVWEVFDINDPSKRRRVLKDTWYKRDKTPEPKILRDIRARLQNKPEDLVYLPEVLMHGALWTIKSSHSIPGNHLQGPMADPTLGIPRTVPEEPSGSLIAGTQGTHSDVTGVSFMSTLPESYYAISTNMMGCYLLSVAIYSVGYIHRRVSSTNILLTEDGTTGVLIDFAYAQKFSEFGQSGMEDKDHPTVK
ncbi:6362_t:CDS:2, partial [Acaulospora colombiana]